jgi:hypothetical protein
MAGELEIINKTLEQRSKGSSRLSPSATAGGYDKAIQLAEEQAGCDSLAWLSVGEKKLCLDC